MKRNKWLPYKTFLELLTDIFFKDSSCFKLFSVKHDKILSNTYTKFDTILLITAQAIEKKWNLHCNQGSNSSENKQENLGPVSQNI